MIVGDYRIRTFRLDVDNRGVEETQLVIQSFLDKYAELIPKYAIALEVADVTKKLHFQGLFWVDKSAKMENALRMFNSWAPSQKAFKPVKKLESYQKYILKQGDMKLVKGISSDDMQQWGTWEEMTKKERKETHRQDQYKRFITFLQSHPKVETGKYRLEWITERMFEFLGKEPLPEQVTWLRGMIFSAQTKLIYDLDTPQGKKTLDIWVNKILG